MKFPGDRRTQWEVMATAPADLRGREQDDVGQRESGRGSRARPPLVFFLALLLLAGVVGWWIGLPDDDGYNDVDVGFLSDMTVHHEGAISLGFDYLGREHDPLVGHFAREIILVQAQQMATMNSLLVDAGNPETAGDDVAMDWMGHPVTTARMPGLATEAEFAELRAAQGITADDVFTRLMIRHHAAGAVMADDAARNGSNQKVRSLAESMAKVQRLEIAEMNHRRTELGLPTVDTSEFEDLAQHGR